MAYLKTSTSIEEWIYDTWSDFRVTLMNLRKLQTVHFFEINFVGSTEAPSKVFLLFFLLPDWLKLNRLKSRMECGFSDIFSRHICSTVAETIGVTNNPASFGAKKCSENHIWSCWDDSWSMEQTNLLPQELKIWIISKLAKILRSNFVGTFAGWF